MARESCPRKDIQLWSSARPYPTLPCAALSSDDCNCLPIATGPTGPLPPDCQPGNWRGRFPERHSGNTRRGQPAVKWKTGSDNLQGPITLQKRLHFVPRRAHSIDERLCSALLSRAIACAPRHRGRSNRKVAARWRTHPPQTTSALLDVAGAHYTPPLHNVLEAAVECSEGRRADHSHGRLNNHGIHQLPQTWRRTA